MDLVVQHLASREGGAIRDLEVCLDLGAGFRDEQGARVVSAGGLGVLGLQLADSSLHLPSAREAPALRRLRAALRGLSLVGELGVRSGW